MISVIHQAIIDKLKTIPDIKQVDYSYNSAPNNYPEACVSFSNMEEEYETQIRVRRIYNYEIMIQMLVVKDKDRNVLYKDFEDLLIKVMKEFGRNSIPNVVQTRPTESIIYEETNDEQEKLIGRITVQVENIERPN